MSIFFDFVLHIDKYLLAILDAYGSWAYLLLFLVIFCETGLVITPFLPGDSLIFISGSLCAVAESDLNIIYLIFILVCASWLGNQCNYHIGRFFGLKVLESSWGGLIKREYIYIAQKFYATHGSKTIVFARFIPIIRTFAPFAAGIARMNYKKFFIFNLGSAVLWISSLALFGYIFGRIPWIQQNLAIMIYGIIFVSLLPGLISWLSSWQNKIRKI